MKKRDLINLYNTLQGMDRDYNIKLSYCIARNLRKLESEYKAVMDIIEPSQEMKTYIAEVQEIQKSYILKDEQGNPIPGETPNTCRVDVQNKEYQDRVKQLSEKYKSTIEEQRTKEQQNSTFLDEDIAVECYTVSVEYLPESISPVVLMALEPILTD